MLARFKALRLQPILRRDLEWVQQMQEHTAKFEFVQILHYMYSSFLVATIPTTLLFWFLLGYPPQIEVTVMLSLVFSVRYVFEAVANEKLTEKQSLTLLGLFQLCLAVPSLLLIPLLPWFAVLLGIIDVILVVYQRSRKTFSTGWLAIIAAPIAIAVYLRVDYAIHIGWLLNPLAEFLALLLFIGPISAVRCSLRLSVEADPETQRVCDDKKMEIRQVLERNPPPPIRFDKTIPVYSIGGQYIFQPHRGGLVDINDNPISKKVVIEAWKALERVRSNAIRLLDRSKRLFKRKAPISHFLLEMVYPRFLLRYSVELILEGSVVGLKRLHPDELKLTKSDRLLSFWSMELPKQLHIFRQWLRLYIKLPDSVFLEALDKHVRQWQRRLEGAKLKQKMLERLRLARKRYGDGLLLRTMRFESAKQAVDDELDWFSQLADLCSQQERRNRKKKREAHQKLRFPIQFTGIAKRPKLPQGKVTSLVVSSLFQCAHQRETNSSQPFKGLLRNPRLQNQPGHNISPDRKANSAHPSTPVA